MTDDQVRSLHEFALSVAGWWDALKAGDEEAKAAEDAMVGVAIAAFVSDVPTVCAELLKARGVPVEI